MTGKGHRSGQHAKGHWACDGCDHKVGARYIRASKCTQYTCGLDGRRYGNVKSCPYRKAGEDGSKQG